MFSVGVLASASIDFVELGELRGLRGHCQASQASRALLRFGGVVDVATLPGFAKLRQAGQWKPSRLRMICSDRGGTHWG
jgi:hypothetical protein